MGINQYLMCVCVFLLARQVHVLERWHLRWSLFCFLVFYLQTNHGEWEWLTGIYSKFQFHLGKCSHMSHWTSNSKQNCCQVEKLKVSPPSGRVSLLSEGVDDRYGWNMQNPYAFLFSSETCNCKSWKFRMVARFQLFLPVVSFQFSAWIRIYCNPACFVILGGAEKSCVTVVVKVRLCAFSLQWKGDFISYSLIQRTTVQSPRVTSPSH